MKATLPAVSIPPPNASEAPTSAPPRPRRILLTRGSARAVAACPRETRPPHYPTANTNHSPTTHHPTLTPHRLAAPDADALLHAVVACLQGCVRGAFSASGDRGDLGDDFSGAVEVMLDVVAGNARYRLIRTPLDADRGAAPPLPDGSGEVRFGEALSPREREIARMVAQGYANKAIATILEISPFTVNTYLRRIFAKLGVPSRAAMVNALHTHK